MQRILPVIISIIIIILVAILRYYSPRVAAITATMPINIPLALWVVYSGTQGDKATMIEFSEGMLLGILPTIIFLIVTWLLLRAGWQLIPVIGSGYAAWGVALFAAFMLRNLAQG
jgi:hypothetical protein